jgi:hypothetical protein
MTGARPIGNSIQLTEYDVDRNCKDLAEKIVAVAASYIEGGAEPLTVATARWLARRPP